MLRSKTIFDIQAKIRWKIDNLMKKVRQNWRTHIEAHDFHDFHDFQWKCTLEPKMYTAGEGAVG